MCCHGDRVTIIAPKSAVLSLCSKVCNGYVRAALVALSGMFDAVSKEGECVCVCARVNRGSEKVFRLLRPSLLESRTWVFIKLDAVVTPDPSHVCSNK